MSDNIRISKLQPDLNSARELLVAREAGSGETLSRKVRKVATVMDLLWSSFRRGWSTKIPNTKSQRGIQTPAALWLLCNVGFLVDSTKFWKVAISPVIKTFIREINLQRPSLTLLKVFEHFISCALHCNEINPYFHISYPDMIYFTKF